MGSDRADFLALDMLKSYGISHLSLRAELPPCNCSISGAVCLHESLTHWLCSLRISHALSSLSIHPSIHPSIHLSSYPCIRSSIHESIHPAMHPCIHFINVRSLCMTYVAAGGWGGIDNLIRTRPHYTLPPKVKSDLTLPYLALNITHHTWYIIITLE